MSVNAVHKAVLRENKDSDTAILMTHGIFGSPNQFEDMAKYFYEKGYTTQTLLLPGHGGTTRDFADTRAYTWRAYVKIAAQKLLENHKKIVLMGHSMGGLLSIETANELGCDALVLIGTPTSINASLTNARNVRRSVVGDLKHDDLNNEDITSLYSVDPPKAWEALSWSLPLMDLVDMTREIPTYLPNLDIPVFLCQSKQDTTIGQESIIELAVGLNKTIVEVAVLEESTHSIFTPEERAILISRIDNFLSRFVK